MIWIAESLIWVIAIFSDWPWLIMVVAVQFALNHTAVRRDWLPMAIELAIVLAAEVTLASARSGERALPQVKDVGLEGAALGGYTLLFGTLTGFLLWQVTLGAGAEQRLHKLLGVIERRTLPRAIRIGIGILLVVMYQSFAWI